MHVYKMMLNYYDICFNNESFIYDNKNKTKGVFVLAGINSKVHAFLGAYYLKSEIQGKDLLSNDP